MILGYNIAISECFLQCVGVLENGGRKKGTAKGLEE